MVNPELHFTRAEYAARLAKVRSTMDADGIELLIVTDPSNMAWLTGYDGWSFYVHQCVLLTLDGEPLWYGRRQDANGAVRTVFMADECILSYPDRYVQSFDCHPMDYLSKIIADRGWGKRTIGVEMDNYYFSAAAYQSLRHHLPIFGFGSGTHDDGLHGVEHPARDRRHLSVLVLLAGHLHA